MYVNTKRLTGIVKLLAIAITLLSSLIGKVNAGTKPKWYVNQKEYTRQQWKDRSVATSGCGVACLAMATRLFYNDYISPETLFQEAIDAKLYNGNGISHDAINKIGPKHGIKVTWTGSADTAFNELRNGKAVIFHVGKDNVYKFTSEGHYIFLSGVTVVNNKKAVFVFDPNGNNNHINEPLPFFKKDNGIEIAGRKTGSDFGIVEKAEISQVIRNFVTNMYNKCLNRTPTNSERDFYALRLSTKEFTGAAVAVAFFESAEFVKLNVSNSEYVNRLYRALLIRSPDSTGASFWIEQLSSHKMSRHDVLKGFVLSNEFQQVCNRNSIVRGSL